MSLKKLWALRYILLGLGMMLWGWNIKDWQIQSFIGLFAIFSISGGIMVWVVESE